MSQNDPIRVFTTHAWELSDDYLRVFEYLESARNFYYRNCSNPEQRPVDTSTEGLRDELRRQMGFGCELPMPREVTDLIDGKSGWDERGLVDAIRQQARHEETQRWDTIEFKID